MVSERKECESEEELICEEDAEYDFASENTSGYEFPNAETKHNLYKDGVFNQMTFYDFNSAGKFYFHYGKARGFSIRACHLRRDNKSQFVIDKEWECCRAGWRKELAEGHIRLRRPRNVTRCGCNARLRVSYDKICRIYRVSLFVEEHNHALESRDTAHWLKCNRIIFPSEKAYLCGITYSGVRPCQAMDYLEHLKGGPGKLGFKRKDGYNCLYKQRMELIRGGDIRTALSWLENKQADDHDLVFRYTVDEDQALTCLFWTDGLSRIQYELFGDVLAFDSTYKVNTYDFPLVVFSGVDNHFKTCIFGAGLLFNEKFESYEWLLQQFKEAMNGKTLGIVLTDHDKTMCKAIESEFPSSKHRLCCWHLARNASTNVSKDFGSDFSWISQSRCSIEQFEKRWQNLVKSHGVAKDPWVTEAYSKRQIWCEAYLRGNFMAMMGSTQRSESFNSVLKLTITRTHKLTEFLMHYFCVISRIRVEFYQLQVETERTSAYVQKGPLECIEADAANLFTRNIFFMVNKEISGVQGLVLIHRISGLFPKSIL